MPVFDEIAETAGDNEWQARLGKVLDLNIEIANFIASRRRRSQATEIVRYLKGSFNSGLQVRFSDEGPDAVIRFPKPGHTAFPDEKVANKVSFMGYLRQNSTIPLPRVIDWGSTAESPQQLGPFIIMDYVGGTHLPTFLKRPTQNDRDDMILNIDIDDIKLDKIYMQIAQFMLQLSRLAFSRIGAISEDPASRRGLLLAGC